MILKVLDPAGSIIFKVLDPAGSSHIFSQFEGGLVYFRFQVENLENQDYHDDDVDNDDVECFMCKVKMNLFAGQLWNRGVELSGEKEIITPPSLSPLAFP